MKKLSEYMKMVGVITLFFFSWSYLPLFQFVAYAATQENQGPKVQSQKAEKQQPAGKLEKLIDDLSAITSKAEEKSAKGADVTSEVESIKARKANIDAIDTDLRKDFAATEQKLKSANLSKEILTRHYKFVKSYEDSLAELKANIDAIEKATTPATLKTEIAKTKKHLDKIKPVKKHIALDPKKLPNQGRQIKHAALEEKKPEEIKILPMQPLRKGAKLNPAEEQRKNEAYRPIMIASNGPLDGLISILPANQSVELPFTDKDFSSDRNPAALNPPLSMADADERESETQLANIAINSVIMNSIIAETLPASDADLVETPEVQFTQPIKDLAAQLNHQPAKIFFWIYNNINTVPTYGSIQGADMCLQTRVCNPIDTVSLMIALYRVSGVHARYTYGTIQIEIEKIMKWLGVTDPRIAGSILASNGIPVKLLTSGGTIKYVQMDHVWVTAWIDYIPSRGAVHKQGDYWLPLDPSIKFYTDTPGLDIQSVVPFDAQTFVNQIQSTATINQTDRSVTNVNSALIQQTMQDYQARVQNYIQQNYPNATVGDVLGKREIKQINWGILPDTRMFKVMTYGGQSDSLPDSLRATISFNIPDTASATNGLSYTTSLAQLAGKKITLSFSPATNTDQAVINSYLPQPHSDGTPLQPSELPTSFPAYLINLKPELRIDGQVVATGLPSTMGSALSFTMSLNEPGFGVSNVDNIIQAGEYYGIGLDTGKMGNLDALKTKLEATKAKLAAQQYESLSKDDLVGDLLYTTMASYFTELDMNDEITAKVMNVVRYRAPSLGMFSLGLNVHNVFSIPTGASPRGFMMDVDRIMQAVFSKDGSMDKVKQFMTISGSTSSMLEFFIPEQLYSHPSNPVTGISATKALKLANDQGIPIYKIDNSNVAAIWPLLQVGGDVKADILNAVNAGKQITVSKSNINYNGWSGCGYIIVDPNTGAGAYMISGALSGGAVLGATMQMLAAYLIPLTATTSSPLAAPPQSSCLQICMSDLANNVLQDYTNCLTNVAIGSVVVGVVVPSIIVLFEPYLLPALIPAIILTTASTLFISVGFCNIRAGVLLMSGALGCLVGCGGY